MCQCAASGCTFSPSPPGRQSVLVDVGLEPNRSVLTGTLAIYDNNEYNRIPIHLQRQ